MTGWLHRLRADAEDRLRYHPFVRDRLAELDLLRDRWSRPASATALALSIRRLCSAARLATRRGTVDRAVGRIHERLAALRPAGFGAVDWPAVVALSPSRRLGMAELLKPPVSEREKGVLFVAFETEWLRLMLHCDLAALARRYDLVLAPSSSPPHNLINYVFPAAFPGPLFTLTSNRDDVAALPRVAANFVVVPLLASHWVDPALFRPLPRSQRDIDLLMVANFAKFKRHHALFGALRRMPASLRVHLIGQDQDGRTADTIHALARAYGVEGRFTLTRNAPYSVVAESLCRARASVVLSRREGSCVVIAESLFADTPAALLAGAEIGSAMFLNERTGRLLPGSDLARELTAFIAESDRYSPRAWAEENISCWQSSAVLNATLREHSLSAGKEWTRDIAPLAWKPFPRLAREEERAAMRPAREQFEAEFGLGVGAAPD